jgi:hypothetical protein
MTDTITTMPTTADEWRQSFADRVSGAWGCTSYTGTAMLSLIAGATPEQAAGASDEQLITLFQQAVIDAGAEGWNRYNPNPHDNALVLTWLRSWITVWQDTPFVEAVKAETTVPAETATPDWAALAEGAGRIDGWVRRTPAAADHFNRALEAWKESTPGSADRALYAFQDIVRDAGGVSDDVPTTGPARRWLFNQVARRAAGYRVLPNWPADSAGVRRLMSELGLSLLLSYETYINDYLAPFAADNLDPDEALTRARQWVGSNFGVSNQDQWSDLLDHLFAVTPTNPPSTAEDLITFLVGKDQDSWHRHAVEESVAEVVHRIRNHEPVTPTDLTTLVRSWGWRTFRGSQRVIQPALDALSASLTEPLTAQEWTQRLARSQERTRVVASWYGKEHDMCGTLSRALGELGIEGTMEPTRTVTFSAAGMTATVEVMSWYSEPSDLRSIAQNRWDSMSAEERKAAMTVDTDALEFPWAAVR